MKCLSILLVFLILAQCFFSVTKKNKKVYSKSVSHKRDPSYAPLPSLWTTGVRSNVAYQVNKKTADYNKKLGSIHKYKDNTVSLLKRSLKH